MRAASSSLHCVHRRSEGRVAGSGSKFDQTLEVDNIERGNAGRFVVSCLLPVVDREQPLDHGVINI